MRRGRSCLPDAASTGAGASSMHGKRLCHTLIQGTVLTHVACSSSHLLTCAYRHKKSPVARVMEIVCPSCCLAYAAATCQLPANKKSTNTCLLQKHVHSILLLSALPSDVQ